MSVTSVSPEAPWAATPRPGYWRAVLWIGVYVVVLFAPLGLALALEPRTGHPMSAEAGKSLGLLAFTILALQFVLAARFKWAERPFGLDAVLRFHRAMAIFATVLLLAHPVLVAAGEGWPLLYGVRVPWFIWLGRLALLALLATILLSLSRAAVLLKLKYEWWRGIHSALALALLGLGFVHSLYAGDDLAMPAMRAFWFALLAVALLAYLDHRVLHPWMRRRHAFRVVDVQPETHNVWTIRLAPPPGDRPYAYVPGQFHFVTFLRGGDLPREEHHWTISSCPTPDGTLTSTIKASGDFTATIGRTKPGDLATVRGPFGRFSYVLHPDETDLVFIAAGIGITPLMAMLRHLRATADPRRVLLIDANRTEADIVFRNELDELSRGDAPRLSVVHVLSKPADDWTGERGRIDEEKIRRLCLGPADDASQAVRGRAFYLCGPPGMIDAAAGVLTAAGVSASRVHVEHFWLASG